MMVRAKRCVRMMKRYFPPTTGRGGMLRLDFNENTRGCSPKVISVLSGLGVRDVSMYPDYTGVSLKIAKYVGNGIGGDDIMITNGSDEAIKCVMDAYVEDGDEVVIVVPTFSLFASYAMMAGANVVEVPYTKDMKFPVDDVISAVTDKTKVVVIVNPNNPTGTAVCLDDVIRIVDCAKDSIVLLDEAYFEYSGSSCVELVLRYDNVFVLRTFSKAFGIAGLRVGYVVSRASNISVLLKVRSPYSIGVDACAAVSAALDDVGFVDEYVKEVKESREMLYLGLRTLGVICNRSSANFVLADFGDDSGYVWQALFLENILVRRWSDDDRLGSFIRIGAGTVTEVRAVLSVVEGALDKKEVFVFDVDGVLIDVSCSYRRAVKETCESFVGNSIGYDEVQRVKNLGGCNNDWDLCLKIINGYGMKVSKDTVVDRFQELYLKYRVDEKWMLSREVILEMSKKYRLGIFSGRPRDEIMFSLKVFGMDKFFSCIVGMEDVMAGRGKPEPDGLFLALKMLGCRRGYYAGDTVDDVCAARKAGLRAIGVLPAQDKSEALSGMLLSSGADAVVDDVNKVLDVNGVI